MIVLNLANPGESDILYKIYKFPDGQQQIKIDYIKMCADQGYAEFLGKSQELVVRIKGRLNNFKDLEIICCAVAALREFKNIQDIELEVPYFLGSRSDRKFELGSANYLKTVICPIVNSLKLDRVIVYDPHSDVLEACLNNYYKKDNLDLVKRFILDTYSLEEKFDDKFILVSPDAGANKKIFKIAEQIDYTGNIITCSKVRNTEGKLTKTFVPLNVTSLGKDFVIIDDICDGGRTFINIAKEIKKWDTTNSCKIYLIISHGIFSRGFDELKQYFNKIYCTNSYSDIDIKKFDLVKQFLVI